MHIHIILLLSLHALSTAVSALEPPSMSPIHARQNNLIPRNPHPGRFKDRATKVSFVVPKRPKSTSLTKSSASCGTNLWFVMGRGSLKDQPYDKLQAQARLCKKSCQCETIAGYTDKQLTCQKRMEVECSTFCTCEPGRLPPYHRHAAWDGSISSTSSRELSSAARDMDDASTSGWESANSEMDEARSRPSPSSWQSANQ
jgi:hypothetical protein